MGSILEVVAGVGDVQVEKWAQVSWGADFSRESEGEERWTVDHVLQLQGR